MNKYYSLMRQRSICNLITTKTLLLFLAGFMVSEALSSGPLPPDDLRLIEIASAETLQFENPRWNSNADLVAATDTRNGSAWVINPSTAKAVHLSDMPSSGRYVHWNPQGSLLGFKHFVDDGAGNLLQVPSLYNVKDGSVEALYQAVPLAGVPSIASDGRVLFMVGDELIVQNARREIINRFQIGQYINMTPVSPVGNFAAFCKPEGGVFILDLSSGVQRAVGDSELNGFMPVWSPSGEYLLVRTIQGHVHCIDVDSGESVDIGEADSAEWVDSGSQIALNRISREWGVGVMDSRTEVVDPDGTLLSTLNPVSGTLPMGVTARRVGEQVRLMYRDLVSGALRSLACQEVVPPSSESGLRVLESESVELFSAENLMLSTAVVELVENSGRTLMDIPDRQLMAEVSIAGVPVIHQVYDTPNWFNGNWACNATAALMAMQYYSILNHWDCTVSVPYSHTSHYGRYVAEEYSFNGHTYNISSPDASGTGAKGGYGYIVRNDWADTKGYMRDYINNHGLSSAVDWSPTWGEMQTEIGDSHPFVLLNSLTSAGHYITIIGYLSGQYTLVSNDPYGNKNTSGYPSYDGGGARYDWPGYNNGYQNLNNAWCFIYCRGTPPQTDNSVWDNYQTPTDDTHFDPGESFTTQWRIKNTGTSTWTKNGDYDWTYDGGTQFASVSRVELGTSESIAPNQTKTWTVNMTAPTTPGTYTTYWQMEHGGTDFGVQMFVRIIVDNVGSLRVNIGPSEAVAAGAQWCVDGGAWKNSGATVSGLSGGTHTVSYKAIAGWDEPANETVSISAGSTTTESGTYTLDTGALTVGLGPSSAVSAGAQWRVDGGAWHNSGDLLSGLGVGVHTVSFKSVAGWDAPDDRSVTISSGSTTSISDSYSYYYGGLQVNLSPAAAVAAGAAWCLDSTCSLSSGTLIDDLNPGTRTVSYEAPPGWRAPLSEQVTIQSTVTSLVTGVFNGIPVLDMVSTSMLVHVGVTWTLDVDTYDPDGDAPWIYATNLPSCASFGYVSGTTYRLSFQPDSSLSGTTQTLWVVAGDDQGEAVSNHVVLTVGTRPSVHAGGDSVALMYGGQVDVDIDVTEPDGDAVTLYGVNLPGWMVLTVDPDQMGGTLSIRPGFDQRGLSAVATIYAHDADGISTQEISVSVHDASPMQNVVDAGGCCGTWHGGRSVYAFSQGLPSGWSASSKRLHHGGFLKPEIAADSDGDGVRNELDPDNDGDGLSDMDELSGNAFDPPTQTDLYKADSDGDGVSDVDEARSGTNPLDPNALLAIESVEFNGTNANVRIASREGYRYVLELRTNLYGGQILECDIRDGAAGMGVWSEGVTEMSDTNLVNQFFRGADSVYYRVRCDGKNE